jgi:16S rRNA (guanine1207-N2)-methyltransferase
MTDLAFVKVTQQLSTRLQNTQGHFLWCTDENTLNSLPLAINHQGLLLMTNRWDVALEATNQGFNTRFNDFDCSEIANESLDGFFYRVSKEKPLVHHLLNEAWRCLKPGAPLVIAGYKNEGTKTYIEKITKLMGNGKQIEKDGPSYSSIIHKQARYNPDQCIDDSDYTRLRPIAVDSGLQILSKPGLFGWNKVDTGSALLIEQIHNGALGEKRPTTCLDLGCGYGYLTLAAAQLDCCKQIDNWILTDNNAAALAAAQVNIRANELVGEVIAADAGRQISQKVDLLLCNPPFHQGFSVDGDLTDKFLRSAQKLLAPDGIAFFVINQFIPLERKATGRFREISLIIDNGSFKVIRLANPL